MAICLVFLPNGILIYRFYYSYLKLNIVRQTASLESFLSIDRSLFTFHPTFHLFDIFMVALYQGRACRDIYSISLRRNSRRSLLVMVVAANLFQLVKVIAALILPSILRQSTMSHNCSPSPMQSLLSLLLDHLVDSALDEPLSEVVDCEAEPPQEYKRCEQVDPSQVGLLHNCNKKFVP